MMLHPQYGPVLADVKEGILSWQIWGRLGWRETRLRYRRTTIGPFWATLSLGIFVGVMGILWSQLWKMDIKAYLPFLTSGMITWLFFSAMVTEGCNVFCGNAVLIKQLPIPYTTLACTIVWRNIIVLFHNVLIYALVLAFTVTPLTWATLLVIPGFILLLANCVWIILLLGLICARYRDVQQLIQTLLQISMFLTPIFWRPDQLHGQARLLVNYNILYHYIEIVRAPMLGQIPEALTWFSVGGATIAGWLLTIFIYGQFRRRITYWL